MTTKVSSSVLSNTTVTSGTYGGANQHAVVTVDAQGRLTSASNVTPALTTSNLTDLSVSSPTIDIGSS